MLTQLPPPPPGKTGWPWTEESDFNLLSEEEIDKLPFITIITPSFNQGKYIEETIRSVLLQNYPKLEYLIIDGGSIDETHNIIRKYESWISNIVIEPDRGQSHAINKGIKISNGSYVNWLCSDDLLCRNALNSVGGLLASSPDIFLLGRGYRIDSESNLIDTIEPSVITEFKQIADIGNYWRKGQSILQQSVLFPRTLNGYTCFLNENNHYSMDYELWGRLLIKNVSVLKTNIPIGMFRWYDGQKTSRQGKVTASLVTAAKNLVLSNPGLGYTEKLIQLAGILRYQLGFSYSQFRSFIGFRRRLKKLFNG